MKVNEIKTTRTIEEVVRTEYTAYDGTLFLNREECEKYEDSALCSVATQLNFITRDTTAEELCYLEYSDNAIDIIDIQTEDDIKYLKQYVYLATTYEYGFEQAAEQNLKMVADNVTIGHPVLLKWDEMHVSCSLIGDGSPEAYGEHFKNLYLEFIENKKGKRNKNG